jgi:hypothetical protein
MKKLYRVQITAMVMANDQLQAAEIAVSSSSQHATDDCAVSPAEVCPAEWWDAIPFGSEDGLTCGEVIVKIQTGTLEAQAFKRAFGHTGPVA